MKVILCPMYHPAAALHQPRLWAVLLDDWQNLPEVVPHDYTIRPTTDKVLDLAGVPLASLDTETDNAGGIGQWSMAYRDGEGKLCVAPFYGNKVKVNYGDCPVAFHNAKYDIRELRKAGMPVPEKFHDTMILGYCLGLGRQAPHDDSKNKSGSDMVGGLGLKYLARRHLGMNMVTWEQVKDHPELVPEYNAADSVATYLLAEKWLPKVGKFYFDIDLPLLPVLMAMEDRGIQINPDYLREFRAELDKRVNDYDETVQHLAFHTVDMQSYVYGTLGIEPWRFTDTGNPSVDDETMESVKDPLVQQVLEYKKLYKEKGTYVDNYIKAADFENRIHPEFKQTSTSTARLSCARPNLQNVFKVGERVKLRSLFCASQGMKLVRMDYRLIEFGMLAVLANDETLINAFLNGDVHQETADGLGIDRDIGKHINFLMQNGGTAWGMAQTYNIPIGLANEYYTKYYQRFPALKRFQEDTVGEAKTKGIVRGVFGRERRIDALLATDWRIVKDGEKEAKTFPMQNGAAEVVKLAMIDLHYKHNAPTLLQIHDELLFEILAKDAEDYAHWIKEYVPTITEIKGVQFPVGVGVGNNWYEAMQNEI